MCECINDIEKKYIDYINNKEVYDKKVIKAELKEITFPLVNRELLSRTYSNVELTLEGRKKKGKIITIHNYCPFCGEKYDDSLGPQDAVRNEPHQSRITRNNIEVIKAWLACESGAIIDGITYYADPEGPHYKSNQAIKPWDKQA